VTAAQMVARKSGQAALQHRQATRRAAVLQHRPGGHQAGRRHPPEGRQEGRRHLREGRPAVLQHRRPLPQRVHQHRPMVLPRGVERVRLAPELEAPLTEGQTAMEPETERETETGK
jgi:hypothetical protein